MGGGAIVLPVLHETIPVNMNTLRLEVRRADDQALITRDRMRVDVMAEFYVRVKPTAESIATAAQTLGQKTMSPNELKNLVEAKHTTLKIWNNSINFLFNNKFYKNYFKSMFSH